MNSSNKILSSTEEKPPVKERKKSNLECTENIDWNRIPTREPIPGAKRSFAKANPWINPDRMPNNVNLEIEARDVKVINELGKLSMNKMDQYMRHVLDEIHAVNLLEEKEYQLGRLLDVFNEAPKG